MIGAILLALFLLGAVCAGIQLFRSHGQDLTDWGLLAVSVGLVLWRVQ